MGRRKEDVLNKKVGSGFTAHDKDTLKRIKDNTGLSYAQILRDSVHAYYNDYFTKR